MSRRKAVILLLSVFTICAALLVSTTGKTGSPLAPANGGAPSSQKPQIVDGGDNERAVLSIAVSMDNTEYAYWTNAVTRFQTGHSGITVHLTNIRGEDAEEALKRAAEAGSPYDMMLLDNDRVREFAMLGYLLPVDEIMTGEFAADQLEALSDGVKWNGSLWGVPIDSDPLLAVWSKKLLTTAGAGEPPRDMTSLLSMMDALSQAKPDVQVSPFNLNTANAGEWNAWLGIFPDNASAAAELEPFNAGQKQQLRYAGELGQALSRFDPAVQTAELMQAFRTDTLLSAMLPWSAYYRLTDDERALLTIGSTNGPVVRSNGRSFVILAGTEVQAEAATWIQAMSDADTELARYRDSGRLPARISVMTGEFAYSSVSNRPPHFLARMLKTASSSPDPEWRGRWVRWSGLAEALGGHGKTFVPETANRLIADWNKEPGDAQDGKSVGTAEGSVDGSTGGAAEDGVGEDKAVGKIGNAANAPLDGKETDKAGGAVNDKV